MTGVRVFVLVFFERSPVCMCCDVEPVLWVLTPVSAVARLSFQPMQVVLLIAAQQVLASHCGMIGVTATNRSVSRRSYRAALSWRMCRIGRMIVVPLALQNLYVLRPAVVDTFVGQQ